MKKLVILAICITIILAGCEPSAVSSDGSSEAVSSTLSAEEATQEPEAPFSDPDIEVAISLFNSIQLGMSEGEVLEIVDGTVLGNFNDALLNETSEEVKRYKNVFSYTHDNYLYQYSAFIPYPEENIPEGLTQDFTW